MRGLSPKLALAAASVMLVTFLVVVDLGRTSPGPLSTAHSRVDGLTEESCDACHGDGEITLASACNECHEVLAEQLADATGFHGALTNAEDCGHCHTEHFGEELPLVGERTFVLAGFEAREAYAHEGLAFTLSGQHAQLDCQACHVNADVSALASGEQRFLGSSQACASCHEDPHEGRMLESCESCHGQDKPFADLDGFVHTTDFPLAGVHGQAKCDECHAPEGAHAVEQLGGMGAPAARDCADCHESPHSVSFIAQVAASLDVQASASCVSCHLLQASAPDFAAFDLESTTRLHSASGFALDAPHDQTDCASCHTPDAAQQRSPDDCAACHASPHRDQFDAGPFAAFDCLACHASERFVPATFDVEAHARTDFPLSEGHGTPACVDCHLPPANQSLGQADFGAVSRDCFACHKDAHEGRLLAVASDLPSPMACETCHQTTFFADGAGDAFEHGQWTSFELSGAHETATCESCHERSTTPDHLGRRFGRVSELFGTPPDECATCHANVHVGQMSSNAAQCEVCHNTTSFALVAQVKFDHTLSTGFELVGAHARAECATCHAQRSVPDAHGRSFGLVTETHGPDVENCGGCHDDPHGGRFRQLRSSLFPAGRIGCARCHDQESFQNGARDSFEHGLWTGLALEDGHSDVACEACHTVPTEQTLGRAPGSNCAACHDDSHFGQFGTGDAGRCERCHESAQAFSTLVFDHGRDSRFALDEQHKKLKCAACHQAWPMAHGGEALRYKPLGTECADCHLGELPR